MKALLVSLVLTLMAAASARSQTATSQNPQRRPRLDPATVATTASAAQPETTTSPVLAMDPYVVHDAGGSPQTSPMIPIPEGRPPISSSRIGKLLESGVVLQHTNKKSKVQFGVTGENGAGGFGTVKVGCSILW